MTAAPPLPDGVPAARFVPHDAIPWRAAEGYANPGAEEKILFHDPGSGVYVRLLRWPAGFVTGDVPLRHDDFDEFAWIVEGVQVSLATGTRATAGHVCVVPVGTDHGPFETPDGVTLLEVRRPLTSTEEAG